MTCAERRRVAVVAGRTGTGRKRRGLGLALVLGAALLAAPGVSHAQFSDSYKFLEAVKKADGDTATKYLNEPGTTIVNTRDVTTGETGLHIAVARRDLLWTRFLLQRGANPNLTDKRGATPLVIAARLGSGSPLGWLWANATAAARWFRAVLSTSRG